MPGIKRKYSGRKRAAPKRRRTMNISRPRRRIVPAATLRVKRMVYQGVLAPAAGLSTGTNYFWQYQTVSLTKGLKQFDAGSPTIGTGNTLTNLVEYQALFDQYKLGAYKVTLRPRMQEINANQVSTTGDQIFPAYQVPYMCILQDCKNTVTPSGTYGAASLNTLLEGGGKIRRADRPINIYIKPYVTEQYGTGAIRHVRPTWTDTTGVGPDMPHNGFHMYLFRNGFEQSNQFLAWDVTITYYLTFRNPK